MDYYNTPSWWYNKLATRNDVSHLTRKCVIYVKHMYILISYKNIAQSLNICFVKFINSSHYLPPLQAIVRMAPRQSRHSDTSKFWCVAFSNMQIICVSCANAMSRSNDTEPPHSAPLSHTNRELWEEANTIHIYMYIWFEMTAGCICTQTPHVGN